MVEGRNIFREEQPGKLGVGAMWSREEEGLGALRVTLRGQAGPWTHCS